MIDKRDNGKEMVSAYEIVFSEGRAKGKEAILVQVGELEVLLNKSNALDVYWVRYKGNNISFLSKNGLNSSEGSFVNRYEGGFLYTCGLDNVSSCDPSKPFHGSLHYQPVENVVKLMFEDRVEIFGEVRQVAFFGENLSLHRHYVIKKDSIVLKDTVYNHGASASNYALLYHSNFGYPFLEEGVKITLPFKRSEGLSPYASSRIGRQLEIASPIDGGEEETFYNEMEKGEISVINERLDTKVSISYDTASFPWLIEWKSMISGDYALGFEASTTRFDRFEMRPLKPGERKDHSIEYRFGDARE